VQVPPVTCYFAHLDQDIFLRTLFSKPLGLISSNNVTDKVSLLYKTTNNIIVLYSSGDVNACNARLNEATKQLFSPKPNTLRKVDKLLCKTLKTS
jgi:hypothetical protein